MSCLLALVVLTLLAVPAYAQSTTEAFASVGKMAAGDDPWHNALSIGRENIASSGIGGGGDVLVMFGRTRPRPKYPNGESYRQYAASGVIGVYSRRAKGFAPFVNGGLSFVTDPDCCAPLIGWNIGGGANYWLSERFGVRTDARLMLPFTGGGGVALARFGMAFR
jgi:hypothetical protein